MKKIILSCLIAVVTAVAAPAQSPAGWTAGNESQKRFIENKSQFDGRDQLPGSKILYAVDQNGTQIYFTKEGLTYRFDEVSPQHSSKERENEKQKVLPLGEDLGGAWAEHEKNERKTIHTTDLVHMQWANANQDVEIIAEEKTDDYFSYTKSNNENINYIKGYKKLIYKNLYPNIDVVYEFPKTKVLPNSSPDGGGQVGAGGASGIKYSLILHPGADASQIKMLYSNPSLRAERSNLIVDAEGNIHIKTLFGDIIDHAPFTFYADNKKEIASSFFLDNNTVAFSLPDGAHSSPNGGGQDGASSTIVIDPWTQTPTLPNSNGVWECERDGAGNVYIIGGDSPMKLLKYNSAGVVQWTYSTPWDTANAWLGTFATDLAGNSYVTSGSIAAMQKVNTNAGLVWNYTAPAFSTDEYWTIAFNCDQTKLIVGGTTGVGIPPPYILNGAIFNIDVNNGNIIGSPKIVGAMFNNPPAIYINEVRSITTSPNGKFYYLTLDTIGSISNFCSSSLFAKSHGYNFNYKCENFRPNNGNGGMSSIKANKNFIYTQNGINVHKRSLATGAIITAAAIPGGVSTSSLGRNIVGNSGIDIDSCGNVYVGSANQVIKYDANLNILSAVATSYAVSDVAVSNSGNVLVCGTTGNSSSTLRTGSIQSINMSACNPISVSPCCDASVCSAGYYCINSPADTLTPATSGGTWSGTGITDTVAGVFDPAVAGVGSHTIYYSLSCGKDSITIVVNSCLVLDACQNIDGSITMLNGTGPFTWYKDTTYQDCSQCLFPATCQPPAANCPLIVNTWISFAMGTTVFPGSNYPILVISSTADSVQIDSLSQLSNCVVSVQENFTNGWNLILGNISDNNQLNGTLFADENADVLIKIIDAQGRIIKTKGMKISKGANLIQMNLNVNGGMYIISIADIMSNRQMIRKFVKE
ncbi:MAG: T9SS type A sorting domain-containing protein [Bacteroidetes bacterium]|nr:T9SS type A sorting domain-containing protein [Bacteroidota bacterium]